MLKTPLWDRQDAEGTEAFDAFKTYLEAGPGRNVRGAAKRVGKARQTLERWASRWHWRERVAAWDAHVFNISREAEVRAELKVAEKWAARRMALREEQYQLSESLLTKVRAMLEFPIAKRVVKKGDAGEETHIHPARWSMDSCGRMVDAAMKLRALSLGEATERVGIPESEGEPSVEVPLNDEQVRAILTELYGSNQQSRPAGAPPAP